MMLFTSSKPDHSHTMFRLIAALAVSFPTAAHSQRIINDPIACQACTIEADLKFRLQVDDARAGLASVPLQVLRDLRGRFVVLVPGELPTVFSAQGAFIRTLGESGAGPGEFGSAVSAAALPGDSLLIVDTQLQRASVFGPGFSFGRSISLPLRGGPITVLKWPTILAINSVSFGADRAGWPLHFLDLSSSRGKLNGSFGDNQGELQPGQTALLARRFFGTSAASFWALQVLRYRITKYSASGQVVESLRRNSQSFPETSSWSIGSPSVPPAPAIQAATLRGDTLWVALRIPRPDWKDAWKSVSVPLSGEISRERGPDRTRLHMTRIEAIDLRSGNLIAHKSLHGIVASITDDLTAVVYDVDAEQIPRLSVFDLRLRNPERR